MRTPAPNPLAEMCPCGHFAYFHRDIAQQKAYMAGTNGRYPGECQGGTSSHCRCVASREAVIRGSQGQF